jgi:hypothetical protein
MIVGNPRGLLDLQVRPHSVFFNYYCVVNLLNYNLFNKKLMFILSEGRKGIHLWASHDVIKTKKDV